MGIDIRKLSTAAQQQVLQKLAAQGRESVQEPRNGKSKYHNIQDKRKGENAVIHFDSRREAARYDELMLLLKAGVISDLRLQHSFTLIEGYTTPDGKRIKPEKYVADFTYWKEGKFVVEDAKGKRTSTYAVKKKQMLDKYGITIREV